MAEKYLDPRNDVVFKRIFGQHKNILRSFLNALLPLADDGQIESLEYLTPEQTPEIPALKTTIVDVRCTDLQGRQFIVEMQMNWTNMFLQRVLFNASKAYVTQLERGQDYKLLKPVFGLAMLDAEFDSETPEFYHDYQMVCTSGQPEKVIEGLRLIFIELPKFKAQQRAVYKPLRQAWLRFMKEVGESKDEVAQEKAMRELGGEAPEIKQAMELARESAYSKEQLEAYGRYWDAVSTERTLITGKVEEARAAALAEGKAEGLAEGEQIGVTKTEARLKAEMKEKQEAMILKLIATGMSEAEARRFVEE